mgnify:CR=1 FL=1
MPMKIMKYKKAKQNTYIITIDMKDYTLYDDIIIKYELLLKKNIKEEMLNTILKENKALESYYVALMYLTKSERCKSEIEAYLKKKGYSIVSINATVNRLTKEGYLNEQNYVSHFLHDEIALTMNGPEKIKKRLLQLNINEYIINDTLNKIEKKVWQEKITKIINKKISTNKTLSAPLLKQKIGNYLYQNGYAKEMFYPLLESEKVENDNNILKREIEKQKRILSRKYSGKELEYRLKVKLLQKGYRSVEIEGEF